MADSNQLNKCRNIAKTMLIAVFVGLLWLPLLEKLLNWDETPQLNEKRSLATFPHLPRTFSSTRDFISGLDRYYSDHFGFRRRLVYWGQRWRQICFKESPLPSVIIGRNGWLFYSDTQTIEDIRATTSLSVKQLQDWRSLLERRRDWLAARGIAYIFVIAPDKHSIYPENLPAWLKKVGSLTKLDQFITHMRANSTVPILDLRPVLLQAKKNAATYLLTDTHWNQYGAFVGYQELIRALSKQLPGLEPLPIGAFERKTVLEEGGNLAAMLAQKQVILEQDSPKLSPRPPLAPLGRATAKTGAPYLTTENTNANGRAVVFRDSFSEAWAPLIGYHFSEVIYCWQYNWSRSLLEQEKPNVVIDELLEHYFYQQDPVKLSGIL